MWIQDIMMWSPASVLDLELQPLLLKHYPHGRYCTALHWWGARFQPLFPPSHPITINQQPSPRYNPHHLAYCSPFLKWCGLSVVLLPFVWNYMQELFSCVLQPDSHTVACRVPNDGNLFGGWQNESAGRQAAVLGRGRKCCAGHKTMTLVALWLSHEWGHFVGQEHIFGWRTVLKLCFLLSPLFIFVML